MTKLFQWGSVELSKLKPDFEKQKLACEPQLFEVHCRDAVADPADIKDVTGLGE